MRTSTSNSASPIVPRSREAPRSSGWSLLSERSWPRGMRFVAGAPQTARHARRDGLRRFRGPGALLDRIWSDAVIERLIVSVEVDRRVGRPTPPGLSWRVDMTKRAHPISYGVLLLACAALVFHVCAFDAVSQVRQGPSTRMVSATPMDASSHVPHVHAASCDGIKPGMLTSASVVVSNPSILQTSVVENPARP